MDILTNKTYEVHINTLFSFYILNFLFFGFFFLLSENHGPLMHCSCSGVFIYLSMYLSIFNLNYSSLPRSFSLFAFLFDPINPVLAYLHRGIGF